MVRSVFFIKSTQKTQNGQLCLNSYSWNTRQSLLKKKKKKPTQSLFLHLNALKCTGIEHLLEELDRDLAAFFSLLN